MAERCRDAQPFGKEHPTVTEHWTGKDREMQGKPILDERIGFHASQSTLIRSTQVDGMTRSITAM
jgi:hypothetical protein